MILGPEPLVAGLRRGRRVGLAGALGLSIAAGLLTAVVMPRGPVTATQALVVIATGLTLGVVGGAAVRSTWVVVPVGVVHLLAIELARPSGLGPTAGAIRLDSTFGILAFIVGRGVH
ncbi:MAG: alpha/beta fold hydrolase, partial [Candidatus Limnocylindrales bacterium]